MIFNKRRVAREGEALQVCSHRTQSDFRSHTLIAGDLGVQAGRNMP